MRLYQEGSPAPHRLTKGSPHHIWYHSLWSWKGFYFVNLLSLWIGPRALASAYLIAIPLSYARSLWSYSCRPFVLHTSRLLLSYFGHDQAMRIYLSSIERSTISAKIASQVSDERQHVLERGAVGRHSSASSAWVRCGTSQRRFAPFDRFFQSH